MKHYKISKLLNDSTVSKFVTRKWIDVTDLLGGQCSVSKKMRFIFDNVRFNAKIRFL